MNWMDLEWNERYPPSPYKQGRFRRRVTRAMEKRAVCQDHSKWEPVVGWIWADLPPEGYDTERFEWVKQAVAETTTGCTIAFTIDPVNGWVARPDLIG